MKQLLFSLSMCLVFLQGCSFFHTTVNISATDTGLIPITPSISVTITYGVDDKDSTDLDTELNPTGKVI